MRIRNCIRFCFCFALEFSARHSDRFCSRPFKYCFDIVYEPLNSFISKKKNTYVKFYVVFVSDYFSKKIKGTVLCGLRDAADVFTKSFEIISHLNNPTGIIFGINVRCSKI